MTNSTEIQPEINLDLTKSVGELVSFSVGTEETSDISSTNFDPISYINSLFPSSEYLPNIDLVSRRIKSSVRKLDSKIKTEVNNQLGSGGYIDQKIEQTSETILDLLKDIGQFKDKSELFDNLANNICKDIKFLDFAKTNLMTTNETLDHLLTLVKNLKLLKGCTQKRKYNEIEDILIKIKKVLEKFENFKTIPKINELKNEYNTTTQLLCEQILEEFDQHLHFNIEPNEGRKILIRCNNFVDLIGLKYRKELIGHFCKKSLEEYNQFFDPNLEGTANDLENIERRSTWFKKRLRFIEKELKDLFPIHWRVNLKFCEKFCSVTNKHLEQIFKKEKSKLNAKILTKLLKLFVKIENELNLKFEDLEEESEIKKLEKKLFELKNDPKIFDENKNSSVTSLDIKKKYLIIKLEKELIEKRKKNENNNTNNNSTTNGNNTDVNKNNLDQNPNINKNNNDSDSDNNTKYYEKSKPKKKDFKGMVSKSFIPYFNIYIQDETEHLKQVLQKLTKEETFVVREQRQLSVFTSFEDLCLIIIKSFEKTQYISVGNGLYKIFKLHRIILKGYCDFLLQNLPRLNSKTSFSILESKFEKESQIKLTNENFLKISIILYTAEYGYKFCENYSQRTTKSMDKKFHKKIQIDDLLDYFIKVINQSVLILIRAIETRLVPYLSEIEKTQWSNLEGVGDQSQFVTGIAEVLNETILIISKKVSNNYFIFFLDKFVNSFVPKFAAQIYKLKKIHGVGGSQLLMDTQLVKEILIKLPTLGENYNFEKNRPSRTYAKYVKKEMLKLEIALKSSMGNPERIMETYLTMSQGNDTLKDLKRILDMSVLGKSAKLSIIEKYNKLKTPKMKKINRLSILKNSPKKLVNKSFKKD
ncbi:vacuolar protein sorting-associated protein [Anaeramoeba flamelloides]|uniref:Vacuolar protein sorting-associated protein n=1 Tax=Anaeramoeba flamelloides TaxID=1746091 RepID=A0ABQ8YC52_9EUKA|nr:vacuolar protein sorting-associated protein [Anaeramoeba flamelloides]